MKRFFLSFVLFFTAVCQLFAVEGDTTFVQVHSGVDMTWYGNYDRTGIFPNDPQKTYRKIWMRYTMGCATGGCSDWDYTTQIFLMHPTGTYDSTVLSLDTISTMPLDVDTTWNVFEVVDPFEMGRVITPYGSLLANSWTREHVFDVTDLVGLLKDSVQIRAFYSGWSSGFSVNLRFEFIEGTPPREVLDVKNIYKGDATYSTSANFESNFFNNKAITVPAGIAGARIFSTITGHGFDNNVNCAEFCVRNYTVNINSANAGNANVWKSDCGSNPTYPQGGTWLDDRAGWCPGDAAITNEFEVGSFLQNGMINNFDFNMQNYSWSGNQAPSYTVNARLVSYGAINFSNDAYLLDILSPTNKFQHRRNNPICAQPKVLVQNTGSNNISSITFQYRVDGADECQYTWAGNLAFLEKAEIELPNVTWVNADFNNQRFYAEIIEVNGGNDEYSFNNTASTDYNMPSIHNYDTMFIEFKTNSRPAETGYQLLDSDGNVLLQRAVGTLNANSTYVDRVAFGKGCYTIKVNDSGKDGLSYWADAAAGTGFVRLSRYIPQFGIYVAVANFESEFGTSLHYPFIVGNAEEMVDDNQTASCVLSGTVTSAVTQFESIVYPNPSKGLVYLDLHFGETQQLDCNVYNLMGQPILHKQFYNINSERISLDLGEEAEGLYLISLEAGGHKWTHKVLILKD
jgi:hypothetical protein